MHEGHRKRTLERLENGADSLQDHELFEILLYNAIPRKNTNPLAHSLLTTFGSIDGVFHASYKQLLAVEGIGPETAAYLKCISIILERVRFTENNFPRCSDVNSFAPFLIERFKGFTREVVEVLAVDTSEHVIGSRRFTSGEIDKASVDVKDFTLFLASRRPYGIILVHNHPNAPSKCSSFDDKFTAHISMICALQNIKLLDHMIVGNDGVFSYFSSGRLDHVREEFNDLDKLINGPAKM